MDQFVGTRPIFCEKLAQHCRVAVLNGCLYIHAAFIFGRVQTTTPGRSPCVRPLSPEPPDSRDKALVVESPPKRRPLGIQRCNPKRGCDDHAHPSNARPAGACPRIGLHGNPKALRAPLWMATTNRSEAQAPTRRKRAAAYQKILA